MLAISLRAGALQSEFLCAYREVCVQPATDREAAILQKVGSMASYSINSLLRYSWAIATPVFEARHKGSETGSPLRLSGVKLFLVSVVGRVQG